MKCAHCVGLRKHGLEKVIGEKSTIVPTPNTFPFNHRSCKTCPQTSSHTSIQGHKPLYQVRQKFQCTSFNLIYCIWYSWCHLLYMVRPSLIESTTLPNTCALSTRARLRSQSQATLFRFRFPLQSVCLWLPPYANCKNSNSYCNPMA